MGEGLPLLKITIVPPAQRVLDEQLRPGEEVLCGLIEQEAQRPHVGTVAAALAGVEELHVAVLELAELQPLRGVVHLCRHHGVGQVDVVLELLVHIYQRASLGKALRHVVVLAAYL